MYVGMITEGGEGEEENMFLRVGRFAASGHQYGHRLGPYASTRYQGYKEY